MIEEDVRSRIVTPELLQRIAQAKQHCHKFAVADSRDAVREVSITLALYALGIVIFPLLTNSLLWHAGVIFCGLVNARTAVMFHDCNHGSLFPVKAANLWVGRFLGALVGINYGAWYRHDLEHHSKLGSSEQTFTSDASSTIFITSKHWHEARMWRRHLWRVLRHPFVFFTIVPAVVFLCGVQNPGKVPGLNHLFIGVRPFSIVKCDLIDQILPVAIPALQVLVGRSLFGAGYWSYFALGKVVGFSLAVIVFHLEHAPAGYRVYYGLPKGEHNLDVAGFLNSTFFRVPWWFRWVTVGLEYHHIHHLNRKVPSYNMKACHDSAPPGTWDDIPYLGYKATLQSLLTTIYDDENCCFVSFPELNWLLPDLKPLPEAPHKKAAALDKEDIDVKAE